MNQSDGAVKEVVRVPKSFKYQYWNNCPRGDQESCKYVIFVISVIVLLSLLTFAGCAPKVSSDKEIQAFNKAGPAILGITDITQGFYDGPYKVVSSDILEFQLPAALRVISSELSKWDRPMYGRKEFESYYCRISEKGTITLPVVGRLEVEGKTLAEIEDLVINAYYPKYVVNPPMVVCKISEYKNENKRIFAVMGLVQQPGTFSYPPDVRYSLMEAVGYAGGFDMVADPHYLRIYRQNIDGEIISTCFEIGSKAMAKASGIIVKPGDIIYVDHTLRTRTNQFLSDVLQIRIGADIRRTSD